MSNYIVCHKKRNNPRVDIRICQKKCDSKEACQTYLTHLAASSLPEKNAPLSGETPPLTLSMP
jgi:hypothetical protein